MSAKVIKVMSPHETASVKEDIEVSYSTDNPISWNSEKKPILLYQNDIINANSAKDLEIKQFSIECNTIMIKFTLSFLLESDDLYKKRSLENFGRIILKIPGENDSLHTISLVVMIHNKEDIMHYTLVNMYK